MSDEDADWAEAKDQIIPCMDDLNDAKEDESTSQDSREEERMSVLHGHCPVCLKELVDAVLIEDCLHEFCKSCILQWVEHLRVRNAPVRCPLCRVSFHRLFLNVCSADDYDVLDILKAPSSPRTMISHQRSLIYRRSSLNNVQDHLWPVIYKTNEQASSWIKRELQMLLGDSTDIMLLYQLITSYLNEIRLESRNNKRKNSQHGYLRLIAAIAQFLHRDTSVFVVELSKFMASRLNMTAYDEIMLREEYPDEPCELFEKPLNRTMNVRKLDRAAQRIQSAWHRYKLQACKRPLKTIRRKAKIPTRRNKKSSKQLTKEMQFAHQLKFWIQQVLYQLHPRTATIPLAFVPCFKGKNAFRRLFHHKNIIYSSVRKNYCLDFHRNSHAYAKLHRWLSQMTNTITATIFSTTKKRLDCAARLIQSFMRCRFATILLASKRKYYDGLMQSTHVKALDIYWRSAVYIQAAWRYSQSIHFWHQYLHIYRLRILSFAYTHRTLRQLLINLPYTHSIHPQLVAKWLPSCRNRRRSSIVAIICLATEHKMYLFIAYSPLLSFRSLLSHRTFHFDMRKALVLGALMGISNAALRQERVARALVEIKAPTISNSTMDQVRSASVGFEKFLTNLRGGSGDTYYKTLFRAIKIEVCQVQSDKDGHTSTAEANVAFSGAESDTLPYHRFVLQSSKYAYKSTNGSCIQVLNPPTSVQAQYDAQYCEVKPNCYWSPIDITSTADRVPVYAVTQAVQPPSGSMTLDSAKDTLTTWAKGFGACIVPSIILLALSVLTIIFFIICRCCCNRCGGRNGKPGGYSCCEKTTPVIFFLLFSIAILVLAGLSYLYSTVITTAVSNVFAIALDLISTIVAWIASLLAPLQDIANTVELSATSISVQLSNSDFIENGLNGILSQLNSFANQTANVTLPYNCKVGVDLFCTPCTACTTISQQVSSTYSSMNAVAGPGVASLGSTRSSIISTLVSAGDQISSFVTSVLNTNADLQTQINKQNDLITNIQTSWDSNGTATQGGFLALFALAIVTIALGVLGVLFGITPLRVLVVIMHLAYIIGFIAIIVTFILSIVFIAFSLLLSDLCKLQVIAASDWAQVLGDEASIVNACFQNQSLINALNLTDSFKFANISFPTLDLSSMLDFSSFDSFSQSISNVDATTFQFNQSAINYFLTSLNSATNVNANPCFVSDGKYDLTNIYTPWTANNGVQSAGQTAFSYIQSRYSTQNISCASVVPSQCVTSNNVPCTYNDFVVQLWQNVSTLQTIKLESAEFINNMQTSVTNLVNYVGNFKSNVTGLSNSLNSISSSLENTLIKDVQTIEGQAYCTFVATTYSQLTDQLCHYMTPSFLMIALFLFLMGVFLIPINITLIIMVKRLRHKKGNTTMALQDPEGNVETLRILLMSDPSGELLNSVDVDGFSALMIAAAEGNSQVVLELLRQGADANLRTFELKSAALHFAAKNGDPVIVEEMCKHTKQIDFWNVNADTPLVWACIEGRDEAVCILLKYGADPRVTNHYGATTLMCATMIGEDAAENSDSARKNIVAMLLEKCPEMANAQDRDGSTAMHLAASCGYLQCVQELLARSADITIRNAIAELTGCNGSEKCVEFLKSRWVILEEEAKARMMTMLEMEENIATTPAKKSKKKKKAKKAQKKKPKVTQAMDSPESEGHSDTEAIPNEEPEASKIKTYESDDNSSPWTTVSRKQTPSGKSEPKKKETIDTPSTPPQLAISQQPTPQSVMTPEQDKKPEPSPSPAESPLIIPGEPSTPANNFV
ncbi:cleavage induced hypothetical protein [Thraustotheca clavata]|uniref:RING-type domain-containing protein n=1 Tax=Thraustotheca clavata TaxID=74557 RepID=A0A1V9YY89_9STRA|nr:cleavage induced hypothetical protein [Thraustotheca clavata]